MYFSYLLMQWDQTQQLLGKFIKKEPFFANPCYTQIHPTCIPRSGDYQSKLTLMSESLRNDGRIWVPKHLEDVKAIREGSKKPTELSEEERDYYLERRYPAFGNLVPRDVASLQQKNVVMLVMELTKLVKLFIWTFNHQLNVMVKNKQKLKVLKTNKLSQIFSDKFQSRLSDI